MAKSSRCFTEPEESYCGNQRVEGQEECDAGLVGQDDIDMCCDKHCKLRPEAVCSDRNSPCCQNCKYMNQGVKCREKQPATCENESRCLGTKAECPKAKPMEDGTPCIEKGQCLQGNCLPYCETQDMQSCMCDTSKLLVLMSLFFISLNYYLFVIFQLIKHHYWWCYYFRADV